MIFLKSEDEIAIIRQSGLILAKVLGVVAQAIKPGIATRALDKVIEECIRDQGAISSFKDFQGFPASSCISVNDAVVHGIPGNQVLKEGDIVSVDCGVCYKGYHSDSAFTFPIGEIKQEAQKLLTITKEALYLGIAQAVVGNRIGDIGAAIESHVIAHGFSVVRSLVGHGIGKELHEEPHVPNYGKCGTGVRLKKGMVLAIEPMVNAGKAGVKQSQDGWTIATADGKLSAHFEHTIAVGEQKAELLTSYQYIDEFLKIQHG